MNTAAPIMVIAIHAATLIATEGDPPRFKITTKKQADAVEVRPDKDKVSGSYSSPASIFSFSVGIGSPTAVQARRLNPDSDHDNPPGGPFVIRLQNPGDQEAR